MRFLADQDVYASTVRFLSGLGHDVAAAGQLGLAQVEDTELLRVAHEQGRILLTRDAISAHSCSSRAAGQELSIFASCPQLRFPCTRNWKGF